MKAKRIAEIAHEMAQLSKEMETLNAAMKYEHGFAGAAAIIAKAIIENTLKAEPPMIVNSDQLRAELTANNIEMNRLTERNDAILSTLRGRGLEPVRVRDDVKCKVKFDNKIMRKYKCWAKYEPVSLMPDEILVGNTIRRKSETPLTNEQLRAGDWFCREVSGDVTQLLIDKEISYCIFSGPDGARAVKFAIPLNSEPSKEIIRKGNEFYYA